MTLLRRKLLHFAVGAAALAAVSRFAGAQTYPSRPVRLLVGFPAGLAPDTVARLIAQALSERLGQQFLVEDRPGAGTNLAAEAVVRAPPDGHTLLLATSVNAANATLYTNLRFNFIRDIAPVASIATTPLLMVVHPSLPSGTVPEFTAYAKANPGKINMASPGSGTTPHIVGEMFKMMTGVEVVHVPYRASYVPDLLSGQVQLAFATIATSNEFVRAGKLRALAVTSATRWEGLPDIPTVGEFVPGFEARGWWGIGAPANTAWEIISILNNQVNAILSEPKIKARLADLGAEPLARSPAEFGKFIAHETERWGNVIRAAGIKAE